MKTLNYLAMDFGAGSGRGMLGRFDGKKLTLEEVSRFLNFFVNINGLCYWDVLRYVHEIKNALRNCGKALAGENLSGIGIDTWGTDYGLIDKNGQLLGNVRCMRNADARIADEVTEKLGGAYLFSRTGIQNIHGNTLFQLYERLKRNDPAIRNAARMLMLPDLLTYFLTGRGGAEYTIASTSMLLNPQTRVWDVELAESLGIPGHIFPRIEKVEKGNRFELLSEVGDETGFAGLPCFPVAGHDTASAVAASPLREGDAFCSSGTWSLMGILIDAPILTEECCQANFSNEGALDGRIRLLKNIMGMWVLQQCMQQWDALGKAVSWATVAEMAAGAKPFRSFVNLEEAQFYASGGMTEKIREYCSRTNQPIPETIGEIARCVYESIAMRYRYTMASLASLCRRPIHALRIVGGGGRNALMNQLAANALGRPVYAGAAEAASAGNILAQAMADGELSGPNEIGEIVEYSFPSQVYFPQSESAWSEEYERYLYLINTFLL